MKNFGQLIGYLICAVPVIGAVAAVVIAVKLVILCFPVIVGVLTLLFLGYATCVGLAHIGSGRG